MHFSFYPNSRLSISSLALAALLPLTACAEQPGDAVDSKEGPWVERVFAVAPDMIALQVQAQEVVWEDQKPYQEREDLEIRRDSEKRLYAWSSTGEIILRPDHAEVFRTEEEAEPVKYGYYSYAYGSWEPFTWTEKNFGQPLDTTLVDSPEAYRISGGSFESEVQPEAVYRKSRPTDQNEVDGVKPYRHILLLQLPEELEEGATYRIGLPGLNTREREVEYVHNPLVVRSDAVQVNQIGYRASDPYKRAYLSFWAGAAGGLEFDAEEFHLIDDVSDEIVHTGKIELGFPASRPEQFESLRNHVQANVYYLDFSEFSQDGNYRVFVPGVGCSFPFEIGRDTWLEAFKVSMHGFLSHRSGIELGAPFSDYERPRPMHPDDGFKAYKLDITRLDGESHEVQAAFAEIFADRIDESKLELHPDAWGGYMDAGDWDRRSQHLAASYDHLELLEMYPEFFDRLKLSLPPNEAEDNLPDLMNEAMWNIDCYRRLQYEDGGVGGGIESTSHPRNGEASWQETLLVGVFAADPVTSFHYAANAAKLSRLIEPYDAEAAAEYLRTAIAAFDYAQANKEKVYEEIAARKEDWNRADAVSEEQEWAPVAAIELYHATADARFHEAAMQMEAFTSFDLLYWYAHYAYARLPEGLGDSSVRSRAFENMIENGEVIMSFAAGNAYGLSSVAPEVPMMGYLGYYSAPEMIVGPVLPRLYALTGEEKYLRAALVAANPSSGANPSNLSYTTGVGHQYPQAPLHLDSRVTGQTPPRGITVYGPSDPQANFGFNNWVHQWHLQEMVPDSRSWPSAESYVDLYKWPAMNEYTVHQQLRPTSFYWGFLAARPEK